MDLKADMNRLGKEEETVNDFLCLLLPFFADQSKMVEYMHIDKLIDSLVA